MKTNAKITLGVVFFISCHIFGQKVKEDSIREKNIQEVILTGYVKEKKSNIAGAVTLVSVNELSQEATPNIVTALQGRVPGLQVNSGGTPGGNDSQISIRGLTTVTSGSAPLWVIDGVQTFNPSSLNSDEIESIQVLKDGASAAIYGTSAANGVIVITTKKGKTKRGEFSFRTEATINTLRDKIRILNLALSLISPNSVTRALWGISERKEKPEVEELVSQNFIKRNLKEEVNSGNILELNEENVKKITLYYDKLYSHLCSSQSLLNEDEKIKMLTVLQLFSSSTFPWNIFYIEPFQFLQLVMALEMLLVPDGTDTRIKSKFSKRLAKLLGEQGQEKEIENKAKKIYSKRSNFVHNAKYFTANSQELLKIVEALQKAGKPLTFEEIVDKTSLKQEIAKNILCRMVKDGKIIKSDKNMYNLHENVIPEEISEQELFSKAQEYACKLVCKYITEPAIFSKENLKKCI